MKGRPVLDCDVTGVLQQIHTHTRTHAHTRTHSLDLVSQVLDCETGEGSSCLALLVLLLNVFMTYHSNWIANPSKSGTRYLLLCFPQ